MRLARLATAHATLVALAALTAWLAPPRSLGAQTIDAGFTRVQVEAKFGPPAAARTVGEFTYLFYNNGCEITCGQHDIVTLRNDKVTDAILRGKARIYGGRSSSPAGGAHQATSPSDAPPTVAAPAVAPPAAVPAAAPAVTPAKPAPTPGSGSAAVPKKP